MTVSGTLKVELRKGKCYGCATRVFVGGDGSDAKADQIHAVAAICAQCRCLAAQVIQSCQSRFDVAL